MELVIAVGGTFHAFTLAEQLDRRDVLREVHTSHPRFKLPVTGIPQKKIHTAPHAEIPFQLAKNPLFRHILPESVARSVREWGVATKNKWFDAAVRRKLQPTDNGIFLGFTSKSLASLERASELGYTTVLENSSSHIVYQTELLTEEYDRFDVPFNHGQIDDRIERITAEYEHADYIMTPSPFARQSFLDRGFSEGRVKCVPFGIDPPEPAPDRELKSTEPEDTVRFIYSGAISLRKGPQYLLEAWDILDLDDAELIITSEVAPTGESLLERYGDHPNVHFVGWVNDLVETFRQGSAFVFPSIEEGSAMVTYEAMSAGLPIITTFNSGWVGENGTHGIEIPIRDPDAIADAMKYLYEHPDERQRMGRAARELIMNEYTEEDYGERIYNSYMNMLAE